MMCKQHINQHKKYQELRHTTLEQQVLFTRALDLQTCTLPDVHKKGAIKAKYWKPYACEICWKHPKQKRKDWKLEQSAKESDIEKLFKNIQALNRKLEQLLIKAK